MSAHENPFASIVPPNMGEPHVPPSEKVERINRSEEGIVTKFSPPPTAIPSAKTTEREESKVKKVSPPRTKPASSSAKSGSTQMSSILSEIGIDPQDMTMPESAQEKYPLGQIQVLSDLVQKSKQVLDTGIKNNQLRPVTPADSAEIIKLAALLFVSVQ